MSITAADIQSLRQQTGAGIMDAKRALEAAGGDLEKATAELRKAGLKLAAKKSDRKVSEGAIGSYVHSNGKVASLVALACETDFVARTDDFRTLAYELAMHVAATNPKYLKPEDIPTEVIAEEEAIYRDQLKSEGKPEAMWDKILPGKLARYYSEVCLLNQPFVKDDEQTVQDLITAATAKLGENIQIQSFSRLAL